MNTNKIRKEDKKVLTEIPENLKHLVLVLKDIIKEDELRDLCKIDQRQLRKLLITLKVDKIVKERLVPEEVDGKLRKINYLFINYKAVINVAKYKIDHIRQKLEVREKDDVNRAHYRCTGINCKRQYDAMDIGKIYDPFSQEMSAGGTG
uniref:Transcription initiation factor IIE subunit alpha N-terminal domain-containing protein n=1 Tax=Globodera rostochiensis TaxID=31243 RepID=A0A914I6V3_GLORO